MADTPEKAVAPLSDNDPLLTVALAKTLKVVHTIGTHYKKTDLFKLTMEQNFLRH